MMVTDRLLSEMDARPDVVVAVEEEAYLPSEGGFSFKKLLKFIGPGLVRRSGHP